LALTVLTGLGLLLVIGVVFSVAYGAQRITTAAVQQQQVSESLRSATVLRAHVAIAVLLGTVEDQLENVNAGDWRTNAIEQSEEAAGDLERGVTELASTDRFADASFVANTAALIDTVAVILDHLEAEEFDQARQVSNGQLDPLYQTVGSEFLSQQATLGEEINNADSLLGWIEVVARFLVAFFIPAAVIIVYREMVIRRQKEKELEHRLDAERQLARAREEFVANASHELRTPLTGIAGMAMILEEELSSGGSEMSRELVDTIIRESSDLERIVEDLLTTARLDAGALHFSFEDVIVALEVEEATTSLIRNGFEIDVDCGAGIVRADPSRLRQIIRNLLSNAKKYGGPNIRVTGNAGEGTYVLEVADDGDGVPSRVREHLFERFVHREGDDARTDSVGLGLSIVHALVVGMGGAISYDYAGGESVFSIRLPLAGERPIPPPSPSTAPHEAAAAPGGGDG
jgi:signal transduction histidine kinase